LIKRIHHIGIAVKCLNEMICLFRDALEFELVQTIDRPGFKAALLPIGGVLIELIEPDDQPQNRPSEILSKLVKDQGGGVHHIAFEVDDIQVELAVLREKGISTIDDFPLEQIGGKVAWLQEDSVTGMLIELCEEGYRVS